MPGIRKSPTQVGMVNKWVSLNRGKATVSNSRSYQGQAGSPELVATCYPKFLTEDTLTLILKLHATFFLKGQRKDGKPGKDDGWLWGEWGRGGIIKTPCVKFSKNDKKG